jgi:uncharacterized protein YciI
MQTFAITYVYTDDTAGLNEHRPSHRAFLQALALTDVVQASGPVSAGDMSGALIIVKAADEAAALSLLDHDPFWKLGLVADRAVVSWNIVIGKWAQES